MTTNSGPPSPPPEPCFPGHEQHLSNLSIDLNPKVNLDLSESYFDRSAIMSGILHQAD